MLPLGAMSGSWFLQRGRADPIGPFTTEEIVDGLRAHDIPLDSLAREVSEAAWRPLAGVPEFRDFVTRAPVADDDAERLAPVRGPSWVSQAERHVGRGGVGTSPLSGNAPTARESQRPSAASKRPPPKLRAPYEPPATSHRLLAMALAGLGAAWTLVRVALVLEAPPAWASLVDVHHTLRAAAIAEIGLGAIVWPLLLVGAIVAGSRSAFGVPLVRASAWAAIVGCVLIAVLAPVLLSRDAAWSIDPSRVSTAAVAAGAPVVLAACAAWVLRFFPDDPDGPRIPSLSAIVVALAGALCGLLLFVWSDVVHVVSVGGDPTVVFTDANSARDDAEGRRLGVAGMFERRRAQSSSFAVPASARARYLDEMRFDLASGPVIVCAVSLLDGPASPRVVYVSSEALRTRP